MEVCTQEDFNVRIKAIPQANLSTCNKNSGVSTQIGADPLKFFMNLSVMMWVTEQATKPPSNVPENLEFSEVRCDDPGERNTIWGWMLTF